MTNPQTFASFVDGLLSDFHDSCVPFPALATIGLVEELADIVSIPVPDYQDVPWAQFREQLVVDCALVEVLADAGFDSEGAIGCDDFDCSPGCACEQAACSFVEILQERSDRATWFLESFVSVPQAIQAWQESCHAAGEFWLTDHLVASFVQEIGNAQSMLPPFQPHLS